MAWESLDIPLTGDLLLRADFEVVRGKVREFTVTLCRIDEDGKEEWIVRYETHGGRAHKHERWDDDGESRHKRPSSWRGDHGELVTAAIDDIQARFTEYEARYDAWALNENK